jgi:hypothetical protein
VACYEIFDPDNEAEMKMRTVVNIARLVAIATVCSGCGGPYESDFPVVVGNLSLSVIRTFANGKEMGDLAPSETRMFTVRLPESGSLRTDTIGNPTSPTPAASVTFSARDLYEGFAYAGVTANISRYGTTYVQFKLDCPDDPAKRCTAVTEVVTK